MRTASRSDQIRGMRHIRGAASAPSVNLCRQGRDRRKLQTADIAAARAALAARRQVLGPRRYGAGGR